MRAAARTAGGSRTTRTLPASGRCSLSSCRSGVLLVRPDRYVVGTGLPFGCARFTSVADAARDGRLDAATLEMVAHAFYATARFVYVIDPEQALKNEPAT